jgi:hypothetical protein
LILKWEKVAWFKRDLQIKLKRKRPIKSNNENNFLDNFSGFPPGIFFGAT